MVFQQGNEPLSHGYAVPAPLGKGSHWWDENSSALTEPGKWNEPSFFTPPDQTGTQRSGSGLERKNASMDMKFSQLLRKLRKRNGIDAF